MIARTANLANISFSCASVGSAFFLLGIGGCRYLSSQGKNGKTDVQVESGITNKKYKKSAVYTRTGDAGTSSLFNGERRTKADDVFQVLGHQDELNAVIGIAIEHCNISGNGLQDKLVEIQSRLFDLGAAVATPQKSSSENKIVYTKFPSEFTRSLEQWIDELDSQLPKIVNFVLPSGGMSATHLNLARTVCRRAERAVVPLISTQSVDAEVGKYLNRLSDFLFVASRFAAQKENRQETLWRKAGAQQLHKE